MNLDQPGSVVRGNLRMPRAGDYVVASSHKQPEIFAYVWEYTVALGWTQVGGINAIYLLEKYDNIKSESGN